MQVVTGRATSGANIANGLALAYGTSCAYGTGYHVSIESPASVIMSNNDIVAIRTIEGRDHYSSGFSGNDRGSAGCRNINTAMEGLATTYRVGSPTIRRGDAGVSRERPGIATATYDNITAAIIIGIGS